MNQVYGDTQRDSIPFDSIQLGLGSTGGDLPCKRRALQAQTVHDMHVVYLPEEVFEVLSGAELRELRVKLGRDQHRAGQVVVHLQDSLMISDDAKYKHVKTSQWKLKHARPRGRAKGSDNHQRRRWQQRQQLPRNQRPYTYCQRSKTPTPTPPTQTDITEVQRGPNSC